MQRRRFTSHKFDENIASEKARLEAEAVKLPPGPQKDGLLKKIRQLDTCLTHERVAFIARLAAADIMQAQKAALHPE
jgi:hypothetical protein